jgi:HSP20 family molecular chaperone IbpA
MQETGRKKKGGEKKRAAEEKMAEQAERIRELEEKIRRLEAATAEEEESEGTAEGTAASVLRELGGVFPGLDRLIQGLEKSEAFRERLRAIDAELEARLRSEPLKRVEEGDRWSSFQTSPSRRTMVKRPPPARRQAPVAERQEVASKEPPVDVFDEETHLKVVAELPGIEEEDVEIDLHGARLVVSANTPAHKYHKETALPCAPEGKVERLYRNGILELTLWKE